MRTLTIAAAALAAVTAAPALADDRAAWIYDDSNHHYLDYKTSISEAKPMSNSGTCSRWKSKFSLCVS